MKIIIFWRSFALGPFQQNERIQFFDQNVGNLVLVEKNVLAVKPVHPTCNSLLMLINLGWLNSIFPFRASPLIFRINTASLTCLVNGSLQIFSTFIFKSIVSPLCFSFWCENCWVSNDREAWLNMTNFLIHNTQPFKYQFCISGSKDLGLVWTNWVLKW